MAGRYVREIEIKAKTDQAEKDILNIQELVDELKKHEYKVNIGVDSQKLEKVIGSLEKMLDSLGKGTGDFKQFENLSKELSDVISEVQSLSKAFGKVDDSGTKTLLSSIQSIDKSLSDLSQHITGVNADFGSIGKNASDNVGQINEAKKATEGLTDATKDLAKAQQNLNGNKSNISSGNPTIKDVFQNEKVEQATTSAKELDKTLEQVNIPKDSFDDVLSKLDLVKSELKDIVKITKQSVSDAEGKFHDSYTLKDSRGSTEIYGLSSNTEKGQLLRSNIVQYDVKDEEQEAKEIQKAWDNAEESITEYLKAKTKLNTLEATDIKSGNVKDQIDAQKQKVEELEVEAENARKVLSNLLGSQDIDTTTWNNFLKLMKDFEEAGKGSSQSIAKIKDAIANVNTSELQTIDKYIKSAQEKLDSTKSDRPLDQQSTAFKSYIDEVSGYIKEIEAEKKRLEDALTSGDIELISEENLSRITDLKKKIDDANLSYKTLFKGSSEGSRQKEIDTINKALSKNSKYSEEAKNKLRGLIETLKNGGADVDVNKIHIEFLKVINDERDAKREGKRFIDIFKSKVVGNFAAQLVSYYLSWTDFIRYAKEGIQTVRELDTALTEMRKVSDESVESLKRYQATTFDVASEVGTTAVQIQNSTADWMRLGYSISESAELAKNSNIYANVGDMEIDEATEHMISSVQAWKSEFNDNVIDTSKAVIDRYNKIGKIIA